MFSQIDKKLAIAPMPSEEQIKDLSMIFKAVVILVEDWELDYVLESWADFGVKVKHFPDFGTPSLDDLHQLFPSPHRFPSP